MKKYLLLFLLFFVFAVGMAAQGEAGRAPSPEEPAAAPAPGQKAEAPDDLVIDGKVVGKKVPPQPGDICMLCNHPVGEGDAVYLVHGQRVALHVAEMQTASTERLQALLAQLKPRGAFLGEIGPANLSPGWFFFGCYVLLGLIFAAVCAHRALIAGQNPIVWLLAGLFLNVFAYAALLTRPKREVAAPAGVPPGLRKISATHAPQACPKCGAENHPSAGECGGCGAKLSPQTTSEVARAGLRAG